MSALLIIGYLALAGIIVFLSLKLSDYVDLLDKTTKISGAVLGGILLAAVTSLPELFTSLTAVIGVGNPAYVLGNILGSDIFDLVVLAALVLIFLKNFKEKRIARCQIWQFVCLIGLYAFTALAIFLPPEMKKYIVLGGWFNILSIPIVIIYGFSIFKLDKVEDKGESIVVKITLKQLIIRFIICAVLLVSASIGITFLSDMLVERFNINVTLAGALLLGVMTSLPEVISTFNLFLKKNINAGTGNIVGSCVFNFLVIFLGELFSFKGSVFTLSEETIKLIVFGMITVFAVFALILIKLYIDKAGKQPKVLLYNSFIIIISLVAIASYVVYLVLPAATIPVPYQLILN